MPKLLYDYSSVMVAFCQANLKGIFGTDLNVPVKDVALDCLAIEESVFNISIICIISYAKHSKSIDSGLIDSLPVRSLVT